MARIRTIKPEFCQSEKIGALSRDARLCFIQIWTIVDDEGRARAAPRLLAGSLYPFDDDAPNLMEDWLGELVRNGRILRYVVDGTQYLEVVNWSEHQRIEKKSASKIPPPTSGPPSPLREPSRKTSGTTTEPTKSHPSPLREPSRTEVDLGSGKGSGREEEFRLTAGDDPKPRPAAQPTANTSPLDPDADLFRRGREVLGKSAGGQIKKLKDRFEGSIPKARAALETASTKHNAVEYIAAVILGKSGSDPPQQLYDRGL